MTKEIVKIPDLGGAEGVEVIEISVTPGDEVSEEQSLLVLESDKATMEVPSPKAGKVSRVLVKEGDTVSTGSEIVELELAGDGDSKEDTDDGQQVAQGDDDQSARHDEVPADEPRGDGESAADEDAGQQRTAATAGSIEEFKLPDLGTDDQVDVIELSVAVGDRVEEGQALGMLESDKATMDVPAPFAGEVVELLVKEGDKAGTGTPFARIRIEVEASEEQLADERPVPSADKAEDDASAGHQADVKPADAAVAEPAAAVVNGGDGSGSAQVYAGPAVRQLARELGVSLEQVKGSGPKGRIQKDDLTRFVKEAVNRPASTAGGGALPQVPEMDFSQFGEIELVRMTKVQMVTATNMQRSWLNAPHVTHFDDADITELEEFRQSLKAEGEKRKIKLTPLAFLLRAVASTLRAHPSFNRSLHSDGKHFVQKNYVHIGVAVDTPRGLLVPVLRDVDQKGLWELAEEISELSGKAREGKLSLAEMQGGCFTISSLGAIGGTGFTPIVNVPEVAILAVSRAQIRPVWNGKKFVPRQLLPLGLSYDHRAVNGADAGRFMTDLVESIGDLRRLLL